MTSWHRTTSPCHTLFMPEVSSAHKNQFTEAALLLLDVLAQAYVS